MKINYEIYKLFLLSLNLMFLACQGQDSIEKRTIESHQQNDGWASESESQANTPSQSQLENMQENKMSSTAPSEGSEDNGSLELQGSAGSGPEGQSCIISLYYVLADGSWAPAYGCPAQPDYNASLVQDQGTNGWEGFYDNSTSGDNSSNLCRLRARDWANWCFTSGNVYGIGSYYNSEWGLIGQGFYDKANGALGWFQIPKI